MRNTLKKLVLSCAVLACSVTAFAGEKNYPIQAFIDREKQETTFVPVNGLWENSNLPANAADAYVSNALFLEINNGIVNTILTDKTQAITLSVPKANGGTYEVELARFDFLSEGFKVYSRVNRVETEVAYTPGVYYRGVVKGIEGSIASFSFTNSGEVAGVFSIPNVGNFVLGRHNLPNANKSSYILYNDMDLKMQRPGGCGTDNLPEVPKPQSANKNTFNSCKDVEEFILADWAMYKKFNNSTTDVSDYIINLYNMIATMYRNEGIYTSIKAISVNTASDVYSQTLLGGGIDSRDWLDAMGDDIQNNLHGADLAILYTTVNKGLGGIAWLNALCASYSGPAGHGPYAFANIQGNFTGTAIPSYSWDIEVSTHEMGHNLSSHHTHKCVWNGNNTAIDGCYTIDGSCGNPTPQYPVAKGTVMSYCHLVSSVGIILANGFGPQPGDKVRDYVNNSPCAESYKPMSPPSIKLKAAIANRECTDENDVTYYWNDNNNAKEEDDLLALMIIKGGSNIGNLDDGTFSVRNGTSISYSNNTGTTVTMPSGMPIVLGNNIAANRYWKITPTAQPTGEVEVIFPFTLTDITDIDGSVPASGLVSTDMLLYTTSGTIDPATSLAGATTNDVTVYTHGSLSSPHVWYSSVNGDSVYASFKTTRLDNGGSVFYTYSTDPNKVNDVYNSDSNPAFYPNPTHNSWSVYVPKCGDNIRFVLYTVDGRIVKEQTMTGNALNIVDGSTLATGLYYYRISSETATYTGNLQKN